MALSSQSAHNTSGRRYMSSRRRRRKRWPAFFLLILVGALVYFMWPKDSQTPDDDSAAVVHTPTNNQPDTQRPAPTPQPQPTITQNPQPTATPELKPATPPPTPPQTNPVADSDQPEPTPVAPPPADDRNLKPPAEPVEVIEKQTSALTEQASSLIQAGKLIEARQLLSDAIFASSESISPTQLETARQMVSQINQSLIFSKRIVPEDPLVTTYVIEPNDALIKIAPLYKTPYQFIALINGITNPNRIRLGQRLKVVKGPFHAIVDKSDFRMDVFVIAPDGRRILIQSFPVGLGEQNSTPLGKWVVRTNSKLEKPQWTDPVTGKTYTRGAADNPIGKFWIGIQGTDENTKDLTGYGIHGTIDPDSIGQMASMGCVRMHAADIELVYKMLVEKYSTVEIRP